MSNTLLLLAQREVLVTAIFRKPDRKLKQNT